MESMHNLPPIGAIKGLCRVDLTDDEKKTLVAFITELHNAGKIQGEDTLKKLVGLIEYMGQKIFIRRCTFDAETIHILWLFMIKMKNLCPEDLAGVYDSIMMKFAGSLDRKCR